MAVNWTADTKFQDKSSALNFGALQDNLAGDKIAWEMSGGVDLVRDIGVYAGGNLKFGHLFERGWSDPLG